MNAQHLGFLAVGIVLGLGAFALFGIVAKVFRPRGPGQHSGGDPIPQECPVHAPGEVLLTADRGKMPEVVPLALFSPEFRAVWALLLEWARLPSDMPSEVARPQGQLFVNKLCDEVVFTLFPRIREQEGMSQLLLRASVQLRLEDSSWVVTNGSFRWECVGPGWKQSDLIPEPELAGLCSKYQLVLQLDSQREPVTLG